MTTYVYNHLGFNLKVTDMQATIGCVQLEKQDDIAAARCVNYKTLYEGLKGVFGIILPVAEENSNPS